MKQILVASMMVGLLTHCGPATDDAPLDPKEQEVIDWIAQLRASAPPDQDGMLQIDEGEHLNAVPLQAAPGAEVEKGSYPALLGWGVKGCLAFQDGTPEFCGRDHCELFGLSCDNVYHSQAARINYQNASQFLGEVTGSCAPAGTANAWGPCIIPDLPAAQRSFTWAFDPRGCPNDPIGRQVVYQGIQRAAEYVSFAALIDMTETSDLSSVNILVTCGQSMGETVAAEWNPHGDLRMLYALADTQNPIAVQETCESDNYPGSNPPVVYRQEMDIHYGYRGGDIRINYAGFLGSISQCAQDSFELNMGARNIFVHELGHHLGFRHDLYFDLDFGIMRNEAIPCEEMVSHSFGYGPLRIDALFDLNTSTLSDGLDVYDDDLSCLIPNL